MTPATPAAPTFDPAQWRQAGRMGIYINPTTGERLTSQQYQQRQAQATAPRQPATFDGATGRQYTEAELAAMELANSPRFASLDPNEQRAIDMATAGVGASNVDLERARQLTERGAGTFLDADINAYMNPYIKGALDPAARELELKSAKDVNAAKQQAAMAGAFGGSRGTLLETETARAGTQAYKDLYKEGYASAFESAANRFDQDRNAAARGAEQFRALGAQRQAQLTQDINTLLTTGGLRRNLEQAGLDFNYEQFLTARDWDVNNLKPLLATLGSVPHSSESTTTAKNSAMANVVGLASVAIGAFFGGGGGQVGHGAETGGTTPGTGGGSGQPASSTFPQGEDVPDRFQTAYVPTSQTFYGVPV